MYAFEYDSATGQVEPLKTAVGRLLYLDTSYTADDLKELEFSQVGDIITITHRGYTTQELRRGTGAWPFTLVASTFGIEDFPSFGGVPRLQPSYAENEWQPSFASGEGARPWQWAVTRVMRKPNGDEYETAAHIVDQAAVLNVEWWRENHNYVDGHMRRWLDGSSGTGWYEDPYVTAVMVASKPDSFFVPTTQSGNGSTVGPVQPYGHADWADYWTEVAREGYETRTVFLMPQYFLCSTTSPMTIEWQVIVAETSDEDDVIVGSRVYKGQQDRYGYIGMSTGSYYIDEGDEPDLSIPPPLGTNPFEILDANEDLVRTEEPATVTMYEGRKVFGGTDERPSVLIGSAVEAYSTFDQVLLAKDTDSYIQRIATPYWEMIRALRPRQQLIVFTDTSEWLVAGSGLSELLTPNSFAARRLSTFGCGYPLPTDVNDALLFMQYKGTVPRLMLLNENNYPQTVDISTLSRHLFTGYGIESWAYAEDPWSIIWAVRSDGTLLSCTFVKDHELVAWARHEITGGTVLSVATIPEGYEDSVYLAVKRGSNVHLERLATRVLTDYYDAIFLDGSKSYDGRNTTTGTASIVTIDDADPDTNNYDAFMDCTVTFSAVGRTVGEVVRVHGVDDDGEPVSTLVRLDSGGPTAFTAKLLEMLHEDMESVATTRWSVCVKQMSELYAFDNGDEVYAVADGGTLGPFYVHGNTVELSETPDDIEYPLMPKEPYWAEVVHIGMKFNADFESLDVSREKGRRKIVKAGTIEAVESRSGHIGQTLDDLVEVRARSIVHGFDPVTLDAYEHRVPITSKWSDHGRMAYRQAEPYPVTLVALTREVELGE
jgi:hypothetical protein